MEQQPLPRRIAWFAPWTWKGRWIVAGVLLLVFVGYPLSVGPAYACYRHGWLEYSIYELVYSPLILCAKQWDPLYSFLHIYVSLFLPAD